MHQAKQAVRTQKIAVIVEGNLDVIASHQAGVKNVVATAGTALTEHQLKNLGRLTPDIRLAFDADRAGIAAAERALPLASKVGVELSVITIEDGKDPDELIAKDPKLWQQAIDNHQPALDWLLHVYQSRLDLTTASGKRQFSDVGLDIVRRLSDHVEQDHYIQKIAEIIKTDPSSLRAKLANKNLESKPLKYIKETLQQPKILNKEVLKAQQHLLGLTLMMPGTRGYLELLNEDMFDTAESKTIFAYIAAHPDFDGDLAAAPQLSEIKDYVKILSLQFDELYAEIDTMELQYEAARLRAKVIEYFVKQQKKQIAAGLEGISGKAADDLLIKARELDQLLNRVKED
jgi:DNA primase